MCPSNRMLDWASHVCVASANISIIILQGRQVTIKNEHSDVPATKTVLLAFDNHSTEARFSKRQIKLIWRRFRWNVLRWQTLKDNSQLTITALVAERPTIKQCALTQYLYMIPPMGRQLVYKQKVSSEETTAQAFNSYILVQRFHSTLT